MFIVLYLKNISARKDPKDGLRILVAAENKPDATQASFDELWTSLAPPTGSLVKYRAESGRREVKSNTKVQERLWNKFMVEYMEHLNQPLQKRRVADLAAIALREDVTILSEEKNWPYSIRWALVRALKEMAPSMQVQVG